MAILIDPPSWPAHGGMWSHLVSDSDFKELHEFARELGVPRRGFDLDHYDVPERLYGRAIALGAIATSGRELLFSLQKSGLRVRQVERAGIIPVRRREFLVEEWMRLGATLDLSHSSLSKASFTNWQAIGQDLITRWNETHRHYHNEQHLEDVLLALSHLETYGETVSPETLLAAWFHDAIYNGLAGEDELQSANYAVSNLKELGFNTDMQELVRETVLATDPTRNSPGDDAVQDRSKKSDKDPDKEFAHLLDADLWVFASLPDRYEQYTAGVRAEYAHVDPLAFKTGRAQILQSFLGKQRLYQTDSAHKNWEAYARNNVSNELTRLLQA